MNKDYDNLLYINTANKGKRSDISPHYNQYEATPYPTLYALFREYQLDKSDGFVDFGCGKGRLLYYVHHRFRSSVTGIEMNEKLYKKTLRNKWSYVKRSKANPSSIKVNYCLAEEYDIQAKDNKFYFFNPFSIQIFIEVMDNILLSAKQHPRDIDVILYYPPTVYTHYLKTETPFKLVQEVKVHRLYEINNRERFLIFRYQG